MKPIYFIYILLPLALLFTGCDTPSDEGTPTPVPTTIPGITPENTSPPDVPTSVPTEAPTYSTTIAVVNNYSNEYRLYIGINDNLYNATSDQWNLPDGEIVISSIAAGTTETYILDLGTNSSLAKDWLLEYYNTFSGTWGVVLCNPDDDADGYVFTGGESYTITIAASSIITIVQDSSK